MSRTFRIPSEMKTSSVYDYTRDSDFTIGSLLGRHSPQVALREICARKKKDMYDEMIRRGYKPDEVCLRNAIGNPLFFEVLKQVTPTNETLWAAVRNDDYEAVKALLPYGLDVNYKGQYFEETTMEIAKPEMARLLTPTFISKFTEFFGF